jgi:hypothetical protein
MGQKHRRSQAIDEVTAPADVVYWDRIYREARVIKRRFHLPLRWAFLFIMLSNPLAVITHVGDEDADNNYTP